MIWTVVTGCGPSGAAFFPFFPFAFLGIIQDKWRTKMGLQNKKDTDVMAFVKPWFWLCSHLQQIRQLPAFSPRAETWF
jgi:hypothetical protein